MPSTSWKCCATKTIVAPDNMVNAIREPSIVLNAALRNNRRSSSGLGSEYCRRANSTANAAPAATAVAGTGAQP
jgi:hypothetical protein